MRTKMDILLENLTFKQGNDILHYNKLSEADKAGLSKDIVDNMYRSAKNKSLSLDYKDIMDSKGDIRKLKNFNDMDQCLKFLNVIQQKFNIPIKELEIVNQAFVNLQNNVANFEQGFRINRDIVIVMYNNLVVALICSISFIIASMLDYIKDPRSNTIVINFKSNRVDNSHVILFINNLDKFNHMCISGDLIKFFNFIYSKEALVGIDLTLGIGIGTVVVLGLLISIVPLIKELIFQYYHMRIKLADYLRLQASFLEMNKSSLSDSKMSKVKANQDAIAKNMLSLADKIDVDQKTSSKKAQMDSKQDINVNNEKMMSTHPKPESRNISNNKNYQDEDGLL